MSNIWEKLRKRCPKCKSSDIEKLNIFKRKWHKHKNGRWELKELQQYKCLVCDNIWWS